MSCRLTGGVLLGCSIFLLGCGGTEQQGAAPPKQQGATLREMKTITLHVQDMAKHWT